MQCTREEDQSGQNRNIDEKLLPLIFDSLHFSKKFWVGKEENDSDLVTMVTTIKLKSEILLDECFPIKVYILWK